MPRFSHFSDLAFFRDFEIFRFCIFKILIFKVDPVAPFVALRIGNMELKNLMFFFQKIKNEFSNEMFVQLFFVAQKLLGCRNYTGMKIMEKEQKNDRFKVSDRNSPFRKRSIFLNGELRSDTLKRSFFCSFSMIFIPV